MQSEDDYRSLSKIMHLMRTAALVVLLINIYWFNYGWFVLYGYNARTIDTFLLNLNHNSGFLNHPLISDLFAFMLLVLSVLGTRGVQDFNIPMRRIVIVIFAGSVLYFGSGMLLALIEDISLKFYLYSFCLTAGFLLLLTGGSWIMRFINHFKDDDPFNVENESFQQETRLVENEYSVNFPTLFYYKKKWNKGWLNLTNPMRSCIIVGTPGAGKSFTLINSYIRQHIEKGFSMYLYDFKFPDLSYIAYNHLRKHAGKYKVSPKMYFINFDDPRYSHRCNPIKPSLMTDIADAYEASLVTLMGMNKSWVQREGDFFVSSPIILLAAIIWYLKIYQDGRYCTFPHAIELLNHKYSEIFLILSTYPELENYMSPFKDAMEANAMDQLQGQIASTRIPMSRLISPRLYWIMSGDDFDLDLNNPESPKILCMGNNPARQNIYSSVLGLYNARIVKMVNQKNKLKCSLILDEAPTLLFKNLDTLIATARSNLVSVCLAAQDFSQLARDYGEPEARVIQNLIGNIISGQVLGDTARQLSERFGRIVQERGSVTFSQDSTSRQISTQLDSLIPQSKISTLKQGEFVGSLAEDFGEESTQKLFHCKITVDIEALKKETAYYEPIPQISFFEDETGEDCMEDIIKENYHRIKQDVKNIIEQERERIKTDPELTKKISGQPKN